MNGLSDKQKLHYLFSPENIPSGLLPAQVLFCADLYGKIYTSDDHEHGRLYELWLAAKSTDPLVNERLRRIFRRVLRRKMLLQRQTRYEYATAAFDAFVQDQSDSEAEETRYWTQLCGRQLEEIAAFADFLSPFTQWLRNEYWKRFLIREEIPGWVYPA